MNLKRMAFLFLVIGIPAVVITAMIIFATDSRPKERVQTRVSSDQTAYAILDRQAKTLEIYRGNGRHKITLGRRPHGQRFVWEGRSSVSEIGSLRITQTRKGTRIVSLQIREDGQWAFLDFPNQFGGYSTYDNPQYSLEHSQEF